MSSVRSRWKQRLPALILLALVVAIYAGVVVKLVHDWYTDPDFSHGFLVPLFSAYLLWTKRLFGLRGGHAAFEAERHSASLLEVERAALAA